MSQWLPIASAPKDGSDIIVGFNSGSVWIVHVAWWRDPDADLGDAPDDEGWWSYIRGSVSQEMLDGHRTPTHWMPLPEIPK
jgi:hypothetical protein